MAHCIEYRVHFVRSYLDVGIDVDVLMNHTFNAVTWGCSFSFSRPYLHPGHRGDVFDSIDRSSRWSCTDCRRLLYYQQRLLSSHYLYPYPTKTARQNAVVRGGIYQIDRKIQSYNIADIIASSPRTDPKAKPMMLAAMKVNPSDAALRKSLLYRNEIPCHAVCFSCVALTLL